MKKNSRQKNIVYALMFLGLFTIIIGILTHIGFNLNDVKETLDEGNYYQAEYEQLLAEKQMYESYIVGFSFVDIGFFVGFFLNIFWLFRKSKEKNLNELKNN